MPPRRIVKATALGVTAVYGKTELAKVLLDAGAAIDGPDNAPFSPLIFASTQGKVQTVGCSKSGVVCIITYT